MARARARPPLVEAAARLRDAVEPYTAAPGPEGVEYVLNPLGYAWPLHEAYLTRYAPPAGQRLDAVLVGMNPGPWGMAQTGVPFGSPDLVREFLALEGRVTAPARLHPKRPVLGLDSPRTEVSGQRLWGGIRSCFATPGAFFRRFFVVNYCPLVFQSASGANLTPDKLPRDYMAACLAACDRHLLEVLGALAPRVVVGVGKWAEKRAAAVAAAGGLEVAVGCILHPSPASPAANRGWLETVRGQFAALGCPWPAGEAVG